METTWTETFHVVQRMPIIATLQLEVLGWTYYFSTLGDTEVAKKNTSI